MNEEAQAYRQRVVDTIALLASASEQLRYERDVPIADVPSELVCGFTDDLFHPKSRSFLDAFTEQEMKSLAEIYGMLCIASKVIEQQNCHRVTELQKISEWRSVMAFAKGLEAVLGGTAN